MFSCYIEGNSWVSSLSFLLLVPVYVSVFKITLSTVLYNAACIYLLSFTLLPLYTLRKRQDKFQHCISHQGEEVICFILHSQHSWFNCKICLHVPSFWQCCWLSQTNDKYCPILSTLHVPKLLKSMVALIKLLSNYSICINTHSKRQRTWFFSPFPSPRRIPSTFNLMIHDRPPRCLRNSANDLINNTFHSFWNEPLVHQLLCAAGSATSELLQ